jgi:DNA-binding Xre family transcriptional regulator
MPIIVNVDVMMAKRKARFDSADALLADLEKNSRQ